MSVKEVLDTAVLAYKSREMPSVPTQDFYSLDDVFGSYPHHSYWTLNLRADRFPADGRILYRPSITDEILSTIEECFGARGIQGLMIKGPQGIGKSHSIVNLYLRLVTSTKNKYLVTFIPFCESWKDVEDFAKAICGSLGLKLEDIGFKSDDIFGRPAMTIEHARSLVRFVQDSVQAHGLRWVFIFDQINSLFAKAPEAQKLEELPPPYFLVKQVMSSRNTVSVIAASANNEIAYKDRHQAFREYHHPPSLTGGELLAFLDYLNSSHDFCQADTKKQETSKSDGDDEETEKSDGETDAKKETGDDEEMEESDGDDEKMEGTAVLQDVQRTTGGVPLYTFTHLKDPINFQRSINEEVENSLMKLRDSLVKADSRVIGDPPRRWPMVKESILTSLLGIPTTATLYDRKYMTVEGIGNGLSVYHPLFPAIAGAFRSLLWEDLMKYVEKSEARLLEVCKDPRTTNDTRGRIFESIAIQRMRSDAGGVRVTLAGEEFLIPRESVKTISGNEFPRVSKGTTTELIIPQNPNFPAIDWIWVNESSVYGVQCHVNERDDVFDKFVVNARKSKWFDNFDEVVLLYFSPEPDTVKLVDNRVDPAEETVRLGRKLRGSAAQPKTVSIKRSAISISSVSSVSDVQWPKGCSLPKKARTTR